MLILITGATGFIGGRIAKFLAPQHRLRTLALPNENTSTLEALGVEIIRGDISKKEDVQRAMHGVTHVYHCAAIVGDGYPKALVQAVTVDGTRYLLEICAEHEVRVVLISSIVVYGEHLNTHVCDEDTPFGKIFGTYNWGKQQQELIARQLEKERGLQVSIVRPSNVIGARSRPWVDLSTQHMRNGLPILINGGDFCMAQVSVNNLARLCIVAMQSPQAIGRAYNGSNGDTVTWKQYYTDLAQLANLPPPRAISANLTRWGAYIIEPLWTLLRIKERPPLTQEALNLVGANLRIPMQRALEELDFSPQNDYAETLEEIRVYLATR
jgi:nucleoside-diphosphate-sugar epimerase